MVTLHNSYLSAAYAIGSWVAISGTRDSLGYSVIKSYDYEAVLRSRDVREKDLLCFMIFGDEWSARCLTPHNPNSDLGSNPSEKLG